MSKVISSASHHAMLFAFIAKRTIDKFGKDGEKAVTDGSAPLRGAEGAPHGAAHAG